MKARRSALKQDFFAVREVLRTTRNPVGIDDLPDDEYDSYAWRIVRLLKEGADEHTLVSHVRGIEQHYFGLNVGEPRLKPVARALLALGLSGDGSST